MKTTSRRWLQPLRRFLLPALTAVLALGVRAAQTPVVDTDHFTYLPQEPIVVTFRDGPGNRLDWVGIYPDGVTPGGSASTAWQYADGAGGQAGVKEGSVLFGGGLNTAGDWKAYLLLNDGYDILATASFRVADPTAPFVRTTQRAYTAGASYSVMFTNGPANPKDWIGIYPADRLPGNGSSLNWSYVDGTGSGTTGVPAGTIAFATGLPVGNYIAYLLVDDSYTPLASEPFTVVAPAPVPARVLNVSPADGATDITPLPTYRATITNGTTRVTASGITLKLNGAVITPVINDQTSFVTVSYTPAALFENGAQPVFELVITDNAATPNLSTNRTSFTVKRVNLTLPAPVFSENFDAAPEGALPSGWTEVNYTDVQNPELDLVNLDSASYATWVTVNASRFAGSFVTYSNPDNPQTWANDYHRVLNYNPVYVVNGQLVTALATGRVAFADSGYRNGTAQIMYLSTPEINLAGKTDIFLSFHSIWEQNQDSMAGVEYSIDGGATWKPALYLLDVADVTTDGQGNVDALATLNAAHGDLPNYTDPVSGEPRGGSYGAFLGAPVDASLAPFISGRAEENTTDSKRVELVALPQAGNQARVKVRFFHVGTDSWYFGIDDVGLYSIPATQPPTIAQPPVSVTVIEGDDAQLKVVAQGGGTIRYQWYRDGQPVPGATGSVLNFSPAKLADAGSYTVRITNEGGTKETTAVTLTVTVRPTAVTGVWNFGDLKRSEGVGTLDYSSTETQAATLFSTTDGTTVPHIGGTPATYMRVPAFTVAADGYNLTMPTRPNGGGSYLNQYTMVWDVLIPGPLNWTPFFNTNPNNPAGNDADFYATDTGTLGIGALGYAAADTIRPDQWQRVAFVADLGSGKVTYYVDGVQVMQRTGGSLRDGRFALATANDSGPHVRLFNEPTGSYTHEILVNSFRFTDRALTAAEIGALGAPTAAGIPSGIVPSILVSISLNGGTVTLNWNSAGSGTYQVQKASSLTNPNWQNLGAATSQTTANDTPGAGTVFYRVRLIP